jgi:NAD(P)-dependent dehydrogenase (short-subunit alcohol dehydrogenase family)
MMQTGDDQLSLDIDRLDGLVYCPGTINLKPFHRLKAEDFLEDFEINVMGAVKSIQDMLPLLKKSENASVVMFSTIAVQQGMGFHSSVAASKGAIEGFARALAAELAPKIRVNVVAPSIVNTPLADRLLNTDDKVKASEKRHPLQKIGTADDIAAMAQLLLSDESSWITGQIMHVDGGMSAIKLF